MPKSCFMHIIDFCKVEPHKNTIKSLKQIIVYKPIPTQPAFTCSKLTIETIEQGVKYVQS